MNLNEIASLQDAAKRLHETVTLHFLASTDLHDPVNQWVACRLSDGVSDGVLYPSKRQAMDYQKGNPKDYCYLKITPDGITVKDAAAFIKVNRHPMIDTTAPDHAINPALYPRFSNLSPQQKRRMNAELKAQQRKANDNG